MHRWLKRVFGIIVLIGSANLLFDLQLRDAVGPFALLLCSAVAFAIPARSGFFNLGVHGQFVAGAVVAVVAMQTWQSMPWIGAAVAMIAACLLGAITGGIPLALRQWGGINEVISSILLNSVLLTGASYVLRSGGVAHLYEASIPLAEYGVFYHLALLGGGLLVALGYIAMTRSGLWILATAHGESPAVLRYSGFRPNSILWVCVVGSAAVASFGAAARVLDERGVFTNGEFGLFAFSGIVGAMLFGDRPAELFSACAVLAVLEALRPQLQASHGVPSEAVAALEAVALIILLVRKRKVEAQAG